MTLEHGIVPDTRAPGYVTGPIWGPLGTSRVRFRLIAAQGTDWPAGWYAMGPGGMSTSVEANPFQTTWDGGYVGGLTAQCTLTIDRTPEPWVVTVLLTLSRSGLPTFSQWRRFLSPVPFNFGVIGMTAFFNATSSVQLYMVKEWVDMTKYPVVPTWLEG